MRSLTVATVLAVVLLPPLGTIGRAAQSIPKVLNTQLPYPVEVSLVQEQTGWTFLSSSNLPLYLFEPTSGKSDCNAVCEKQWIPLLASAGEKSLGYWTILVRKDGQRQWAFQQYPVYTHLHDTPEKPTGHGAGGLWHLMPHFRS